MHSPSNDHFSAVISGSFRKHLREIFAFRDSLATFNIEVLSPKGKSAVDPKETFVILDVDPIRDHKMLQDNVFSKIRRSSCLIIFNKDGYLGNAMLLEMGYALASGVPILALHPVDDPNLAPYVRLFDDVFQQPDLIAKVAAL